MDDSGIPDAIVEKRPADDSTAGVNESHILLGKRTAECEASNDSAYDEVSLQVESLYCFCSPFGCLRGESPFSRCDSVPTLR